MVRKLISLVIIASMIMHCAARLGVVSYVYEKRHDIAYTVGLIAEVPIALCSSDYEFDPGLKIHTTDDADRSLPPSLFQEIQLFFCSPAVVLDPALIAIDVKQVPGDVKKDYLTPAFSIFHPPS